MLKKIASLFSIILIVIPIALALFNATSKRANSGKKIYASKKISQLGEYSFGNKSIIINDDRNNGFYLKNTTLYTPSVVYKISNVQVIKHKNKKFLGVGFRIKNVSDHNVRVYEDKTPYNFMRVKQNGVNRSEKLKLVHLHLKKEINSKLTEKKSTTGVLLYKLVSKNEVNLEMLDKQKNVIGNLKFNVK
ncbi:hypothetical protein JK163_12945 [Levilactobacillus brevis]|uniref:hypothetical protein n=1 Tax=Levilactobacillus brevis TaxID=1580 RepID=UPI001BAA289D|nr:hypothetical protein [Levilactobacillus brevis]MBS1007148.1 hypothetical protein [Levilactobacillus brevis]MBS1014298.1 hypothetical protein [Levilactobacillus brevis]